MLGQAAGLGEAARGHGPAPAGVSEGTRGARAAPPAGFQGEEDAVAFNCLLSSP